MKVKIKKSLKPTLESAFDNVYMLGTAIPVSEKDSEKYFKGKDLQICLRPLSDEPICYRELEKGSLAPMKDAASDMKYDVFGKHVFTISRMLGEKGEVTEVRSKKINEFLENNFILFNPTVNTKRGTTTYHEDDTITCEMYKNITGKIVAVPKDQLSDDVDYVRVPRINKSILELKQALENKECIDLLEHPVSLFPPDYLLCENYLVQLKYGSIEKACKEGHKWCFSNAELQETYVYKIEDESRFIKASEQLYFVSDYDIGEYDFITKLDDIVNDTKLKKKSITTKENKKEETVSINKAVKNDEEINFLKKLRENCLKQGLVYTEKDLVNLHTSIKTSELTIISGRTGTGKSQLATQYSELLCGKKHLVIPVEVSFQEADDILGYLNVATGVYISAKTKLVDFLLDAQKDLDNMYTVIFDEMNLAQVEHWFAPFISVLEQKNKKLRLYNGYCVNSEKYPEELTIGDNVRFIGTINLDETVKDFSDRLLDRANQIELTKKSFSEILNITSQKDEQDITFKRTRTVNLFKDSNSSSSNISLENNIIQFLDELDEFLSKHDYKKGISYRVLEKINTYINCVPKTEEEQWKLSKAEALDLQIAQRVISKVKGTARTLNGLLVPDEEYTSSPLYSFFEQEAIKEISEFTVTKKLVERKIKELISYGYTY